MTQPRGLQTVALASEFPVIVFIHSQPLTELEYHRGESELHFDWEIRMVGNSGREVHTSATGDRRSPLEQLDELLGGHASTFCDA